MDENELEMGMFSDSTELNFEDAPEALREFLEGNDDNDSAGGSADDDNKQDNLDESADADGDSSQEEDSDEEGDDQSSDDTSPNPYSSFATVLHEQGLLPSLDLDKTKVEDIDSLANAIAAERDNQVKQYLIDKIGQDGYEAIEKGVTLAEYQQYEENVLTLENISEEAIQSNLDLGKQIILQDYIAQGISEERAQRILAKTIDLGEEAIIEEATISLGSLKQQQAIQLERVKEERAAAQAEQAKQQEKIDNDLKNAIYNGKEIIEGVSLTKAMQDKVYNSITKIVGTSPNGTPENKLMRERRENPVDFDTRMYYLYELTNGFTDFSSLVTKSKSKAAADFEKSINQPSFRSQGNPAFLDDPESYDGSFGSELVL